MGPEMIASLDII